MPKIMIVDNDAVTVSELAEALKSSGYDIAGVAESGEEGIAMASKTKPDLVLMDIIMPGGKVDGIAAATKIREENNIPVIFLTGHSETRYIEKAKKAKSFGYLLKPFNDQQVRSAIEIGLYNFELEQSLRKAHADLEKKVEERTADLAQLNEQMSALLNATSDAAQLIDLDGNVIAANAVAAKRLKLRPKELPGRCIYDFLPPQIAKKRRDKIAKVADSGKQARFEDRMEGSVVQNIMYPVKNAKGKVFQVALYSRDVSADKRVLKNLKKREKELEARSVSLQEANTALSVLLRRREEDRTQFETSVISNIGTLIKPYIKKLKNTDLDETQWKYVDVIESNLDQIVSPFVRDIGSQVLDLTPMEIRVANLVKAGKSNKEIALNLGVSKNTILTHRFNLRRKLGIKNKKINLRAYLLSFI